MVPESRDHDVLVLMSYDRVSWKQIRANFDNEVSPATRRVRLDYLPNYIGLYTRHRMTSLNVDAGGGMFLTCRRAWILTNCICSDFDRLYL